MQVSLEITKLWNNRPKNWCTHLFPLHIGWMWTITEDFLSLLIKTIIIIQITKKGV